MPESSDNSFSKRLQGTFESAADSPADEAVIVGTMIGGAVLGIAGLVVGAIAGAVTIPAIAAGVGVGLGTSILAGTTAAGASFLGISAPAWIGGALGAASGFLIQLLPISGEKIKRTESYKMQAPQGMGERIILPDEPLERDHHGMIRVRPEDLPRIQMTAEEYSSRDRLFAIPTAVGAFSGVLTGAFAGAVAGGLTGATLKAFLWCKKQLSPGPKP